MQAHKIRSFTLSEMLVVMIITAIVVGLAFSVLSLVQKQVRSIQRNFAKTTELSLFEQRLWQDFNQHNTINYQSRKLQLFSDIDTTTYTFLAEAVVRNTDTIRIRLKIEKAFYNGRETGNGTVDAVLLSGISELPGFTIFACSTNDATQNMNTNGL